MSDDAPHIVYADMGCALSVWRNVMIPYFATPVNTTRIRWLRATQRDLARQPDPLGCLLVTAVAENSPAASLDFSEALRRELLSTLSAYRDRQLAASFSVEGEGFVPASRRMFFSGAMLILRPKYPTKIFGERAAAARWLLERIGGGRPASTVAELLSAVAATAAHAR